MGSVMCPKLALRDLSNPLLLHESRDSNFS